MSALVVVVRPSAGAEPGEQPAGRRDVPPIGALQVDPDGAVALVRAEQPDTVVVAVGIDALTEQPLLARLRAVAPTTALVIVADRDAQSQVTAAMQVAVGPSLRRARVVPVGRSGPTEARAFVRGALEAWRCDELVQDAELLVSELASNAALHAGGPVEVALVLTARVVRIEVRDMSRSTPEVLDPDRRPRGGHGLRILMRLAVAWGVQPTDDGKVVWADLAR